MYHVKIDSSRFYDNGSIMLKPEAYCTPSLLTDGYAKHGGSYLLLPSSLHREWYVRCLQEDRSVRVQDLNAI